MKNRSNVNNIEELIERINKLEIENRSLRKDLKQCIKSKPSVNTQVRQTKTTAKDAKGRVLEVGQKVRFVTKGKYKSTEGIIETIKETRVVSIDNKKNKIVRAHQNVEIIPKDDERRK
jgi:hypothetical protein